MSNLGLPVSDPGLAVFCEWPRSACLWPRFFCPQNPSSSMPQTTTPVVIPPPPPQASDSPVLRGCHTQPPTLSYGPCPSLWCRSTPQRRLGRALMWSANDWRKKTWSRSESKMQSQSGTKAVSLNGSQTCQVSRVCFFWCYDGIDAQNLLFTSQMLANWCLGRWMGARFGIVWGGGEWNCVREWSKCEQFYGIFPASSAGKW